VTVGGTSNLSFQAVQLLGRLAQEVGDGAPADRWFDALSRLEPRLAAPEVDATVGTAPAATTPDRARPLTSDDVASMAAQRAAGQGRPLATAVDVAAVLASPAAGRRPPPPPPAPAPGLPPPPAPAEVTQEAVQAETVAAPAGRTRTFRLFVSSTFDDFAQERDALRRRVWPRLRDDCRRRGARFQEVDLRWGVSEEAAVDQRTMDICLDEVARCHALTPRPNFLVLIGDRYGWLPPPPRIPGDEWALLVERVDGDGRASLERWYARDDNAAPAAYRLRPRTGGFLDADRWQAEEAELHRVLADAAAASPIAAPRRGRYLTSATEQEIVAGAFGADHPDQVLCFSRELTDLPEPVDEDGRARLARYVDEDRTRVQDLRTRLRAELGEGRVLHEQVPWGEDGPAIDEPYLERFTDRVYRQLRATIDEELEHPLLDVRALDEPADPHLDAEGAAHHAFAVQRRRFFTGRDRERRLIEDYLGSRTRQPLVIHGAGGTGKSSLLAVAAQDARVQLPGAAVVSRFVGASPASSDGRALLHSIARELARRTGDPAEVPTDEIELVAALRTRLERASAAQPLVVLVDGLDQLAARGAAPSLAWIPVQLPPDVRLLLSTRPGVTLDRLRGRAELLEVGGLGPDDGAELLTRWLDDAGRTLQPAQRAHVLERAARAGGNPLYLRVAFEEARRWSSDGGEPPATLPVGVQELLREVLFRRLERDEQHGRVLVAHALGYLAMSRYGLSEDELLDLLSRDLDVYRWFLAEAHHVPPDLRDLVLEHRADAAPTEAGGGAGPGDLAGTTSWLERLRTDPDRGEELEQLLATLLPRDDGPRLPVVLWSRLFADLEPYLTERRAEGGDLLDFHHRELAEAATEAYAPGDAGRRLHDRLADYLLARADPQGDRSWRLDGGRADLRGLSELPYHLTRAGRWEDLEATLTDFTFLEQKATYVGVVRRAQGDEEVAIHTGVFELQHDLERALAALAGEDGPSSDRPRPIVTATDLGAGLVVRCPHCQVSHRFEAPCPTCAVVHHLEDWRGRELSCPNPTCGGPLRVNGFVVERRPSS
jgi:NACHT domain- and WD repeat-containing protein